MNVVTRKDIVDNSFPPSNAAILTVRVFVAARVAAFFLAFVAALLAKDLVFNTTWLIIISIQI